MSDQAKKLAEAVVKEIGAALRQPSPSFDLFSLRAFQSRPRPGNSLSAGIDICIGPVNLNLQLCWSMELFISGARAGRHLTFKSRFGPLYLGGNWCVGCWLR